MTEREFKSMHAIGTALAALEELKPVTEREQYLYNRAMEHLEIAKRLYQPELRQSIDKAVVTSKINGRGVNEGYYRSEYGK